MPHSVFPSPPPEGSTVATAPASPLAADGGAQQFLPPHQLTADLTALHSHSDNAHLLLAVNAAYAAATAPNAAVPIGGACCPPSGDYAPCANRGV